MIRSTGEAGTGEVSNATTHMRKIGGKIRRLRLLFGRRINRRRRRLARRVFVELGPNSRGAT
jgi:pyridoxal biosynthesis lyase PdxS